MEKPICQWKVKKNYRMENDVLGEQIVENLNTRFFFFKLAMSSNLSLSSLSYYNQPLIFPWGKT